MSSSSTTTTTKTYLKTGIGGCGNYHKSSSLLQPLTSAPVIAPRTSGTFLIGIGGAGNTRNYEDKARVTWDRETARKMSNASSVLEGGRFHYGIGGAGNRSVSSFGDRSSRRNSTMSVSFGVGEVVSGADRLKEKVLKVFMV